MRPENDFREFVFSFTGWVLESKLTWSRQQCLYQLSSLCGLGSWSQGLPVLHPQPHFNILKNDMVSWVYSFIALYCRGCCLHCAPLARLWSLSSFFTFLWDGASCSPGWWAVGRTLAWINPACSDGCLSTTLVSCHAKGSGWCLHAFDMRVCDPKWLHWSEARASRGKCYLETEAAGWEMRHRSTKGGRQWCRADCGVVWYWVPSLV